MALVPDKQKLILIATHMEKKCTHYIAFRLAIRRPCDAQPPSGLLPRKQLGYDANGKADQVKTRRSLTHMRPRLRLSASKFKIRDPGILAGSWVTQLSLFLQNLSKTQNTFTIHFPYLLCKHT